MLIQIGTDQVVHGDEELIRHFEEELTTRLSRFSDHITRLEAHFKEEAADDGMNRCCVLEARPAGRRTVAVSHHAGSVDEACRGAVHKLESMYGRADHRKGGDSIRHQSGPAGS
ncbi:HPF/RaiA family ribosome-associated protein [Amycolatopsis sp. FDAARGOS 1241]|uniref:HPF/RaiA family ribosome-associated protein n=1 Tax=Amycolatopsis sp. FDAARGOS 1241 TaxID=2778070 RepID=UPI0019512FFA|nr:HPF/RaiA family ribosome-associated protein [Amycolatopsis sp. FDAARGOS 1241]QRP47911.1 HPF/RaiA family ribosome-associated protein [Amycolatopsis sp. FDAARGOS 1241]